MMTKYLLNWKMSVWNKHKVDYKQLLHGPKCQGKGGNNGHGFVLKVGCNIANWKLLWRPYLLVWSSCLKKPLSLKMSSLFVMVYKNMLLYKKEYLKPKCGLLLRQSPLHWIMLY
jgi:hypothetical protein